MQGVSRDAMAAFERLQKLTGTDLKVNSAYRDPEHNARVGGAKNSQHTHGNAFDIDASGLSQEQRGQLIRQARQSGFRGIGVYNNALHFDVGGERSWGSDYTGASTPEWAKPYLTGEVETLTAQAPQPDMQQGMNRLAMMQALPKWQNRLNIKDFINA